MKQLACLLIALAVVGVYGQNEMERIVNGMPSSIDEYPQAVSIRINNQHNCGGTIIGPYHILTAAHCVVGMRNQMNQMTVVTGTSLLNSGGQAFRVANMWAHEQFNMNSLMHDIGIIKLQTPISFTSKQRSIALPTRDIQPGEPVTVVAWGSRGYGQPIHNDLRKLNAQCIAANDCQRRLQGIMNVYHTEFCTFVASGTGTCHGDSGSGLISNGAVVGLVSRGYPCARGYPDVFTRVNSYNTWIRQKMAQ